jgi:hypothetical protein
MIETLILTPIEGKFDVQSIERFLQGLSFSFRDPTDPDGPYLLCGNAGAMHYSRMKLLTEPNSGYPYVVLVRLGEDRIRIAQMAQQDALQQAAKVAEFIRSNYPCRIVDEEGNDYTDECRDSVASLYT